MAGYCFINIFEAKKDQMYSFLKNFHSGFRYIVFLLIVIAIVQSIAGLLGKKSYTDANRKMNLFAMISAHTQLLVGLVLYFVSPLVSFSKAAMKNDVMRYFTAEHIIMMIVAIVLITIGHSKSKKAASPGAKHKAIAIFYTIALLVVVGALLAGHLPIFGKNR